MMPGFSGVIGRKIRLEVSIERLDNGYVVHLSAPPEQIPEPEPPATPPNVDAQLNKLMEGIPALGRAIAGGSEGEEWKNSENLGKAKDALKAIFPDLGRVAFGGHGPRPFRQEDLVFGSKEDLLAWLSKNI